MDEVTANSVTNGTGISQTVTLGPGMYFDREHLFTVVVYTVLFVIAGCGNLTVFFTLCRSGRSGQRSRIGLLVMHLSMGDLIVTFITMPLEIAWNVTVTWEAGDVACRILMFFRALGFYLSSFVLIVISVDRYYAVAHPLSSLRTADYRAKVMLTVAWILGVLSSAPQVSLAIISSIIIC